MCVGWLVERQREILVGRKTREEEERMMCCGDAWAPCGPSDKRRASRREKRRKTITRPHLQRFFLLFLRPTVCLCAFVCLSTLSCGAGRELEEESDNKNKESLLSLSLRPRIGQGSIGRSVVNSSTTRHVAPCE